MLRCVLIAVLLGGVCLMARAETVRFYLPSIPGIYEERDGKPAGLYADLLQHMAGHAGISLSLFIASRPRIQQSMLLQDDACSAVTLAANAPAPEGMQYVFPMGQTQAQLFTRPADALTLDAPQPVAAGGGGHVARAACAGAVCYPCRAVAAGAGHAGRRAGAGCAGVVVYLLKPHARCHGATPGHRLAPGAVAPSLGADNQRPTMVLPGLRWALPGASSSAGYWQTSRACTAATHGVNRR